MTTSSTQITLTPNHYPLLVTFTDLNDPASIKRVDPSNLEATFGSGYRLNDIMLTLTDEPLTKGQAEKVLSWLNWSREKLLLAGHGRNPVQLQLPEGLLALDKPDFRSK